MTAALHLLPMTYELRGALVEAPEPPYCVEFLDVLVESNPHE